MSQAHPLYLADVSQGAVRAGAKRTTIRVHDPVRPGRPVRRVFERDDARSATIEAVVTEVRQKALP